MRNLLFRSVIASGFTFASAAHADFDTARAAYERGDFSVAAQEFRKSAELGHPDAQFNLGAMYYKGQGVEKSAELAFAWIYLAAENGIQEARSVLEQIKPELNDAAVTTLQDLRSRFGKAALQGRLLPSPDASSESRPPDLVAATITQRRAEFPTCAALDTAQVESHFGSNEPTLVFGFGILVMYIDFARDGSARAIDDLLSYPEGVLDADQYRCWIGMKYPTGTDSRPSESRTMRVATWTTGTELESPEKGLQRIGREILPCARNGSPACQHLAALMPFTIEDLGMNWDSMLLRAAQGGSAPAQYAYGRSLMGYGGSANRERARAWLEIALANGVSRAGVALARLEATKSPNPDWRRARQLLEAAREDFEVGALIPLAALLAAAPDPGVREPARVLELIKPRRFYRGPGNATEWEIFAAASAAQGDFGTAIDRQDKALKAAQKLGWDIAPLDQRRAAYEAHQPWFGDLLAY